MTRARFPRQVDELEDGESTAYVAADGGRDWAYVMPRDLKLRVALDLALALQVPCAPLRATVYPVHGSSHMYTVMCDGTHYTWQFTQTDQDGCTHGTLCRDGPRWWYTSSGM